MKPLVLDGVKPRNPFVALSHKRKAGSHTKSGKAIRRKEKIALMRDSSIKVMHSALTRKNTDQYRGVLPLWGV